MAASSFTDTTSAKDETIFQQHMKELKRATASELQDPNRASLWQQIRIPFDLDPDASLRGAKRPRLIVIDEDALSCPVCSEGFTGDKVVRQCNRGHLFCENCSKRLANVCPVCKITGEFGISLLAQTISQTLTQECKDCKKLLTTSSDRTHHQWICCMVKSRCCPFCDVNINRNELNFHLEVYHILNSGSTWAFDIPSDALRLPEHVVWKLDKLDEVVLTKLNVLLINKFESLANALSRMTACVWRPLDNLSSHRMRCFVSLPKCLWETSFIVDVPSTWLKSQIKDVQPLTLPLNVTSIIKAFVDKPAADLRFTVSFCDV